jgi:hypothetical protein
MKERTTQALLLAVGALLAAHLVVAAPVGVEQVPEVLRARAIELVDGQGQVVAQLHVGADGGGNLRLRAGDGTVRVKLGATADGSGLVLLDKDVEPAVWLAANKSGTRLTLAEKGKEEKVFRP